MRLLSYQIQIDQAKKITKNVYPIDGKAIVLLGELDFNYFLNCLKLNNFRYRLTYLSPKEHLQSLIYYK